MLADIAQQEAWQAERDAEMTRILADEAALFAPAPPPVDWAEEEALRQMREKEAVWLAEFDEQIHDGYKIGDLRLAFHNVKDAANWKDPISAGCRTHEKDVTAKAITFFTGSVARFTRLRGDIWLVEADGYYRAIGA
jgi:hypothetical protein